jgi:quinol-cytochrome oxidoreductase complex cytochrome b subunit
MYTSETKSENAMYTLLAVALVVVVIIAALAIFMLMPHDVSVTSNTAQAAVKHVIPTATAVGKAGCGILQALAGCK